MLTGHGDDAYRYPGKIRADFSSNVRADAPLEPLHAFLRERLACLARYPEPAAESLVEQLAEHSRVGVENIIVTNGAVAAIYLVAQAFRGRRSQIFIPTFCEYEDAARVNEHSLEFHLWESFGSRTFSPDGLSWLCNPNNPTGEVVARDKLLSVVDKNPQTVFVVDLAYAAFAQEHPLRAKDAQVRENLLLVHSLTKEFALPGLRLGFISGGVETMQRIRNLSTPWSVNALAIEAGKYLLSQLAQFALPLGKYLSEAANLRRELAAIPGLSIQASATGFFLVELAKSNAAQLKADLVAQHGLLIRDASNFRGLSPRYFRVATQTPEKNALLGEALRAWMHS